MIFLHEYWLMGYCLVGVLALVKRLGTTVELVELDCFRCRLHLLGWWFLLLLFYIGQVLERL
jgi:hypothetical protein